MDGHAPPVLARRITILIACATLAIACCLTLAGPGRAAVAYHLLTDGVFAMGWVISAFGWGELIFRASPALSSAIRTKQLRAVCAAAIGIGAMSLLILALGLIGAMSMIVAWLTVLGGLAIAVWCHRAALARLNSSSIAVWLNGRAANLSWAWLAIVPALAIVLVSSDAPPGLLWGDEPKGYDVVEYHLQVPREWYEAGRITPLKHNVFSYMPMAVEMHYLLAMHLRGGPWDGMYLAQLMHAAMTMLAVAGAYAIAREGLNSDAAGILAAIAMSSAPWMMLLAPIAYNEGGLLLFGALAIGLTWLLIKRGGANGATLIGVMCGFACSVKLTAAPMLLVAIPVAQLIVGRSLQRAGTVLVIGVLVFSPWLMRNFVWTGNPVFPEATRLLGRAHFSETQSIRWDRAHSPPPVLQPIVTRFGEASRQIIFDWRYGYALLPIGLAAAALRWKSRDARFLLIFVALLLAFWIGATHLQSRFFVLAIPAAALSIAALDRWPRWIVATALSISALVGVARWEITYDRDIDSSPLVLGMVRDTPAFGMDRLDAISGIEDLLASIPPEQTIAFVGDAKMFVISRPMKQLRYRTVFDVDAKANQSAIDAWLPSDLSGDAVIIVDPGELKRFAESNGGYYAIPTAPTDVTSRELPFILRR